MAISDFTVRMSGTVAYTDGSHGSFETVSTWRGTHAGLIAQHSSSESQEHFNQLLADKSTEVNAMFAVLPGTITFTTPAPTNDKTVDSFIMEISGLVTYDDNSKGPFIAQWVNGALDLLPDATVEHWAAVVDAGSDASSFMDQVFESVSGESGTTVNQIAATLSATMLPVGTPTVVTRGSGYSVTDELTASGGTATSDAVFVVSTVSTVLSQNETDFASTTATFTPGTGYNALDTITMSDGTVVTVDSVGTAGDVITFDITTVSTSGNTDSATLTQSATSGGGTNFDLTLDASTQGVFAATYKQSAGTNIGQYTVVPTDPVGHAAATGSGATFNVDWGVRTVVVTDGGLGYTSAPTVTFSGGSGTTATATVAADTSISAVTVTAAGSGYSAVATVTVPTPGN